MINFNRFWMNGDNPYEDEPNGEVTPGVTEAEILDWERDQRVRLPEPIRTALGIRNGGYVRNCPIQVLPLDEIAPVAESPWDYIRLEDDEDADPDLLFVFGSHNEASATLLLNFNANGPEGPPSVYFDHHGESTYLVNKTVHGFFETQLAASDEPGIDWAEAEASPSIISRETIDVSPLYGGAPTVFEQILSRDGEALVLFTRLRSPEGAELSRTRLPLPIDAELAQIGPRRPAPMSTMGLHLQPVENEGIVHDESRTNQDGRWKDSTLQGGPVYVVFESTDPGRLQALRREILGDPGAARAQSKADRQREFQALLDTLTPEQRTAAMLQAAMDQRAEHAKQLGAVPPELADALGAIQARMEAMASQVRQKAAANPVDPETLRRISEYLRHSGD